MNSSKPIMGTTSREDPSNASPQVVDASQTNASLPSQSPVTNNNHQTQSKSKPDTSDWRPLNILKWGLSNSTKIIGWNDDDFRELLEEHRRRRKEDPSTPNVEETGFGLMGILANTIKEALYNRTDFDDLKSDLKKLEKIEETDASNSASSIDIIGTNVDVREMKVYKNLLSVVKYQRDAYIMGSEHAERRKVEREVEREKEAKAKEQLDLYIADDDSFSDVASEGPKVPPKISYQDYLKKHSIVNASSLGSSQLNGLFSWFIPSPTMHNALLPTVLWTIAPISPTYPDGGPLRGRINRSVCDLIPLSQSLLDGVMKQNILWVLSDESWRESVKGSSRNYLSAAEGGPSGNTAGTLTSTGGRVITTKTLRLNKD